MNAHLPPCPSCYPDARTKCEGGHPVSLQGMTSGPIWPCSGLRLRTPRTFPCYRQLAPPPCLGGKIRWYRTTQSHQDNSIHNSPGKYVLLWVPDHFGWQSWYRNLLSGIVRPIFKKGNKLEVSRMWYYKLAWIIQKNILLTFKSFISKTK